MDVEKFENLGIIKNDLNVEEEKLDLFEDRIKELRKNKTWKKDEIVDLFFKMIPSFGHKETGKYLDSKM